MQDSIINIQVLERIFNLTLAFSKLSDFELNFGMYL